MGVETKFHSWVIGITTLLVFALWKLYNSLIPLHPIFTIIGASLVSLGLYRLIASILLSLTQKSKMIRKWLLGPAYLEGTWVGFYIGLSGKVRFIIEHFEQKLDTLIVRGRAYTDEKKYHTSWISFPAHIDLEKAELSYMYELKGIGEEFNGNGVLFFSFHRPGPDKAPTTLRGFSADLHNKGFRTKAIEYKLSDSTEVEDAFALEKAMAFYEKNKDIF